LIGEVYLLTGEGYEMTDEF